MQSLDLYNYTQPQVADLIASWGMRPAHAATLWRYLYRQDVRDIAAMSELPARLRERLLAEARIPLLETAQSTVSDDGLTRKFLLRLDDARQIETVLMQTPYGVTACVSSQAGCPLGCVFCATGQMGFERNLTTGEIVAQVMHVARLCGGTAAQAALGNRPARADLRRPLLRNIVMMGMGEPLLNYDAVMRALEILHDPAGLALGAKQITVSTVGVAPGIVRLTDEKRPYSLAVSLHSAIPSERAALVPAAKIWPLEELMSASRYYAEKLQRKILFEWTLIPGRNDSLEEARRLAELLQGLPAQVNLIPLNPTAGYRAMDHGEASRAGDALARFRHALDDNGIPVTVRHRRGIDIAAGCGQLATANG
jgi:23S rRNA (adenine2503-C2)-methyltransferase